jgi:hypothetical protein
MKNMKHRALVMTGILAAALVFGIIFVGCDDGSTDTGGGGGISITSSYTDLADRIAELPANTAATPHTVKLERTDIMTDGVMGGINTAVAGQYVVLDLSDCSAADNTISGAFSNPGPNNMNVIKNNDYIVGVILPSGLTSIGECAFSGCSYLTGITIPGSVTSIGDSAFAWCDRLTSVTIPAGVTSIGAGAFWVCGGLTGITIPAGVTSIGDSAFYGCSGLTSVTIPGCVEPIGDLAFQRCRGLPSVSILEGVTGIGV